MVHAIRVVFRQALETSGLVGLIKSFKTWSENTLDPVAAEWFFSHLAVRFIYRFCCHCHQNWTRTLTKMNNRLSVPFLNNYEMMIRRFPLMFLFASLWRQSMFSIEYFLEFRSHKQLWEKFSWKFFSLALFHSHSHW